MPFVRVIKDKSYIESEERQIVFGGKYGGPDFKVYELKYVDDVFQIHTNVKYKEDGSHWSVDHIDYPEEFDVSKKEEIICLVNEAFQEHVKLFYPGRENKVSIKYSF